jgi:propanol-preferring alcohol dehydrogenase
VVGSLLGSQQEIAEMFDLVAEHNIRVKANFFYGLDKLPDLMELAHSGKMSGKPIIVVDQEAADEEKRAGIFPV